MARLHRLINRSIKKAMQKTKAVIIVNNSLVASNTRVDNVIASAVDTARANYFDNFVKPFAKISQIEVDLQFFQDNPAAISPDAYVDFAFWKSPAGGVPVGNGSISGAGLTYVPYIFRMGTAAIPMMTGAGIPSIYHLHGVIKIPKRFQTMAPGDLLYFSWRGNPVVGASSSAVIGRISYMFKI